MEVSPAHAVAHLLVHRLGCVPHSDTATKIAELVARVPGWDAPELDAHVEAASSDDLELRELFDGLDAAELWHAAACAAGQARALRELDARYIAPLDGALRSLKLDAASVEDVKQRVREKLLVPPESGVPLVLQYAGGGRLASLVKVMAMRTALNGLREQRRRTAAHTRANDATVERIMAENLGPELRVIDDQHRRLIKQSFESAIASLERADRGVLRLHVLERLTIDEIAALHAVHRSTAARRLARIRSELSDRAREQLQSLLSPGSSALESVMRAVDSRLDLSLARVLAVTR